MPTKTRRKRQAIISVELYPADKQKLDDIVRLAKLANAEITAVEVIRKMIRDLHSNLGRAGLLPLPKPPEIFVIAMKAGGNGHEKTPVEP